MKAESEVQKWSNCSDKIQISEQLLTIYPNFKNKHTTRSIYQLKSLQWQELHTYLLQPHRYEGCHLHLDHHHLPVEEDPRRNYQNVPKRTSVNKKIIHTIIQSCKKSSHTNKLMSFHKVDPLCSNWHTSSMDAIFPQKSDVVIWSLRNFSMLANWIL